MPTGLDALIRFAYAEAIGREFNVPLGGDRGILVGGHNGRGDDNVRRTDMPAVLLEALFGSNPAHAERIRTDPVEGGTGAAGARAGGQHPPFLPEGRAHRLLRRPQVQVFGAFSSWCAGCAGGASGDAEESGREEEAGAVGAKEADKGRRLAGRRALL
jgi:hypothetical protein